MPCQIPPNVSCAFLYIIAVLRSTFHHFVLYTRCAPTFSPWPILGHKMPVSPLRGPLVSNSSMYLLSSSALRAKTLQCLTIFKTFFFFFNNYSLTLYSAVTEYKVGHQQQFLQAIPVTSWFICVWWPHLDSTRVPNTEHHAGKINWLWD